MSDERATEIRTLAERGVWIRSDWVLELLDEQDRLREALRLTYGCIDDLCARPGTCMPVRPRPVLEHAA